MRENVFTLVYANGSRETVEALIDPDGVTRVHLEQYLTEIVSRAGERRGPIMEIKYQELNGNSNE